MPIFERTERALNKIFGTATLWHFFPAALAAGKRCHKVVGGTVGEGRERRTIVHTRRMFPLVIVRRVQSIKPIKALAK